MNYAEGQQALSPNRGSAAFQGVSVPHVATIDRVADPVRRNLVINLSYHAIHESMTAYLGHPYVANWATFGQHASTEVGVQLRNLRDAFKVLGSLARLDAWSTISQVMDLMSRPGMVAQSIKLALKKGGVGPAQLNQLYGEYEAATSIDTSDLLIPLKQPVEMAFLTRTATQIAAQIVAATPDIIKSLGKVRGNMVEGNRQIYLSIAPAYAKFLRAANGAPGGVVGPMQFDGDAKGFLAEAFAEYSHVRRLANELSTLDKDDPKRAALIAERQGRAARANLLIGYQEQLLILQPIFDTMPDELSSMSGTMTLGTPAGTIDLAPNWGDFYTRMGIDRHKGAPKDPMDITVDNLPPLLDPKLHGFKGTIGELFTDGLTDQRLQKRHVPAR